MKILVTGASGFIGKNLIAQLKNKGYSDILACDVDTEPALLDSYVRECAFVFHLAGVNRPNNPDEFMTGNRDLTANLLECLQKYRNKAPVLISSSIQAKRDNPYGRSKKAAEDLIFAYGKESGVDVFVYRLPNVFGKWCRPNYNSAVATFCFNIARNLPVQVNDSNPEMSLAYIDDVIEEFICVLKGSPNRQGDFCFVEPVHQVTLGRIVELLGSFRESRENLRVLDTSDLFVKKLYSTYLSYLSEDNFSYPLTSHIDARGSFTEIIRTPERGQFSVVVSKPGVTRGNHWHHTKTEKFLTLHGDGVIRLRRIDSNKIIEYLVSSERPEVVDVPPGYTHSIVNMGSCDLIAFIWANECFDPEHPDTYPLEVNPL